MKTSFSIFLAILLCVTQVVAQAPDRQQAILDSIENERPVNKGYLTFGVSGAISTFFGDLNTSSNVSTLNSFRINPGFHIEKRLGKFFSVGLSGLLGKISQNERSGSRQALNFESSYTQVGAELGMHFDTKHKHIIAPFFSVGAHFINFKTFSDLRDQNDLQYYYWSIDNTLRAAPYQDQNGVIAPASTQILERDFTYETELSQTIDGSQATIKNSAMSFPITLGMKFRLAEFFDVRLAGMYNILTTDFLDAFTDGTNDSYFNTVVSMHYTIGKKYVSKKEKKFKGVDFGGMAKTDADRDGITDIFDECPNTPSKVKVDSKGCPLDDDNDGVANYLDKEPNSAANATVNRDGITLTEQELEKLYQIREQTYFDKVEKFYEAPSDSTLKSMGIVVDQGKNGQSLESIKEDIQSKVESGKLLILPIPEYGKFADANGDGKLQPEELSGAIDQYLDGEADISVTDLMSIIEYFFEQ